MALFLGQTSVPHVRIGSASTSTVIETTKSVSPSTSTVIVTADSGYDAMEEVVVAAMPSGVASTPATTFVVTPAMGVGSTGVITATVLSVSTITPTITSGYIASGTAGTITISGNNSIQLTSKAATTFYPSTADQSITTATYLTGKQTFASVKLTNLAAANIKSGVVIQVGDSANASRITSVTGTYTGGGGSGIGTLLSTSNLGAIATTSTTAYSLEKSMTVSGVQDYDLLLVEVGVSSKVSNRHVSTGRTIFITNATNVSTKNRAVVATATWNEKLTSTNVAATNVSTTVYGIFPSGCTLSTTGTSTTATLTMYARYNSTHTGTISGTYIAKVYGINVVNLV